MKDFTLKQCKYTISHKDINPYTFDDFYEYYIKDNVRLTFTYNERLKYMFKIHSGLEINIILGRTEKQTYIINDIYHMEFNREKFTKVISEWTQKITRQVVSKYHDEFLVNTKQFFILVNGI